MDLASSVHSDPSTASVVRGIAADLHVLLVEDAPFHVDLISRALASVAISITHVEEGLQAMSLLRERRFDLVVLDWNLPDVSGKTVLEWMHRGCDQTPVIVVTVEDVTETAVDAMRGGAQHYVVKRVEGYLDKLIAATAEVLNPLAGEQRAGGQSASSPDPQATPADPGSTPCSRVRKGVFRREGEYFTTEWESIVRRFKGTNGMECLAILLAHPGHTVSASELRRAVAGLPRADRSRQIDPAELQQLLSDDRSGTGAMLDRRSETDCRQRLKDIGLERAEAEEQGDEGRQQRLNSEVEYIERHLRRSKARNGRDREEGSRAERDRQAVTKAITMARRRIRREHPALARHLRARVRTGHACVYDPDLQHPVVWEV